MPLAGQSGAVWQPPGLPVDVSWGAQVLAPLYLSAAEERLHLLQPQSSLEVLRSHLEPDATAPPLDSLDAVLGELGGHIYDGPDGLVI